MLASCFFLRWKGHVASQLTLPLLATTLPLLATFLVKWKAPNLKDFRFKLGTWCVSLEFDLITRLGMTCMACSGGNAASAWKSPAWSTDGFGGGKEMEAPQILQIQTKIEKELISRLNIPWARLFYRLPFLVLRWHVRQNRDCIKIIMQLESGMQAPFLKTNHSTNEQRHSQELHAGFVWSQNVLSNHQQWEGNANIQHALSSYLFSKLWDFQY